MGVGVEHVPRRAKGSDGSETRMVHPGGAIPKGAASHDGTDGLAVCLVRYGGFALILPHGAPLTPYTSDSLWSDMGALPSYSRMGRH